MRQHRLGSCVSVTGIEPVLSVRETEVLAAVRHRRKWRAPECGSHDVEFSFQGKCRTPGVAPVVEASGVEPVFACRASTSGRALASMTGIEPVFPV